MDVGDLVRLVYKNDALDRRSAECRLIKARIAAKSHPTTTAAALTLEITPSFTEEQREYIRNNMRASSPLEMARLIGANPHMLTSDPMCIAVTSYCRQVDPGFRKDEEMVDPDYDPPKNPKQLIIQVNRYAINPRHDGKPIYDEDKLSSMDQKQIRSLIAYMNTTQFRARASKLTRRADRELFVSTFVGYCWNKSDLLREQVDQYIAAAGETVKYIQIERTVQILDERLNSMLEGVDGQLKMAEVELLNTVREKSNASMKNIAALIKTLVGERAKQQEARIAGTASLHNLVEAWAQYESRQKIIALARKNKSGLVAEVERLSTMDSLRAEIFGLDPVDILR